MRVRTLIINTWLLVTLLATACNSHRDSRLVDNATYFVMTGREAEKLVCQCVNGAGEGVDGYWVPAVADLQKLDVRLHQYVNSLWPAKGAKLLGYDKQCAGMIKGGRKIIFVIGVEKGLGEKMGTDISKEALVLVGGGEAVYHTEYDVEAEAIQYFGFNPSQ